MRLRGAIKHLVHEHFPGCRGQFRYYGKRVYFPPGSLTFQLACEQGIYEAENLQIIQQSVEADSVYFDIGANIGLMSLPILVSHPGVTVVSVEASPHTWPYLQQTKDGSGFGERWRIVDQAVAANPGTAEFFMSGHHTGALDGLRDTGRGAARQPVTVQVTTIDRIWASLGNPPVSVIKLDIEGGEYDALMGAQQCLRIEKPLIHMEWNAVNLRPYGRPAAALLDLAQTFGYALFVADTLTRIESSSLLRLQMARVESFLLIAEHGLRSRD